MQQTLSKHCNNFLNRYSRTIKLLTIQAQTVNEIIKRLIGNHQQFVDLIVRLLICSMHTIYTYVVKYICVSTMALSHLPGGMQLLGVSVAVAKKVNIIIAPCCNTKNAATLCCIAPWRNM